MRSYTPVVKAKKNDLGALCTLTTSAKARVLPLIESPIVISGSSLATQSVEAAGIAAKLLGDLPFLFDPLGIEAPSRQLLAFRTLVDSGASFIPTLGLARNPIQPKLLRSIVEDTQGKFAVRLELDDIEDSDNNWDAVSRLVTALGSTPSHATLILDFAQLKGKDLDKTKESIIDFLALQPKYLLDIRFILMGSSALNTVSDVPIDGELDVTRRELVLWARIRFELADSKNISFGDYGIVDPSFLFAGGPSGNANAKIRYTCGARTKYFRGHGLYNPNRFDQYHELAQRVANSAEFIGGHFSQGDQRIVDCASYNCGPGNLATWVRADMNHHMEYTAAQVARIESKIPLLANEAETGELLAQE